jgi:hypothetical protein
MGDSVVTLFGKRVVVRERDVVLFEKCEFCGSTDKALDENNRCSHCGAYVTGSWTVPNSVKELFLSDNSNGN